MEGPSFSFRAVETLSEALSWQEFLPRNREEEQLG